VVIKHVNILGILIIRGIKDSQGEEKDITDKSSSWTNYKNIKK
jgi:hypothetical protein